MIQTKYQALAYRLNEAALRTWLATEAQALGRGGVSTVARATGMSRTTIYAGLKELQSPTPMASESSPHRVRAKGGGRKRLTTKDTTLLDELDALVDPSTRGDPQSPLRWTCKSTPRLAKELTDRGHLVSQRTVCTLLAQLGYSLQSTRKTLEGGKHPDRDAQFQYIASQVAQYQAAGDPVISIDAKKKELIGDFKNGGQEWQPQGKPEEVRVYDFIDPELGKVTPYGIYDLTANQGWVSIGINHDTGRVRRGKYPPLVAGDGQTALSQGATLADYSRWWRKQRLPCTFVARTVAETGGQTEVDHSGLPSSSGNQQVEQD